MRMQQMMQQQQQMITQQQAPAVVFQPSVYRAPAMKPVTSEVTQQMHGLAVRNGGSESMRMSFADDDDDEPAKMVIFP